MTVSHRVISVPCAPRPRRLALLAAGIAGVALLGGCSSNVPHPDKMAQQARDALNHGETPRAVALAEQAVLADGRNPALRVLLANAYLRGGRFESARISFADAIELGDDSSRAALGLVLCDLAMGHNQAALDTINTYGDVLPAADLGLALVMAGQNERGVTVLTNAIRQGQNIPKVRQNLALAYALSGMWSEARIMAGQDVPADQVDARVQSWAAMARPEDGRRRIASLVGAPLVNDAGRPEALALAHFPGAAPDKTPDQPVAQPKAVAAAPAGELPPTQTPLESGALARIDLPPATAPTMIARPVVQPLPAATPVAGHPAPGRTPLSHRAVAAVRGPGTHLVQLGAFNSEESARRAWRHFASRDAGLQGHPSMITRVTVNGRDFWRVQAAGFGGQAAAASMCGTVRAHGGACMVMAVNAAARVNGVQMAAAPVPAHPALQPAAAHPAPAHPAKPNPTRK
jgi:Flp pilus assembly protein TadD